MPCFRCSARQTDPARGASPWRRGVVDGEQVLVCPGCQAAGVEAELDRCSSCGSRRLAKALGEVMCRGCGRHGPSVAGGGTDDGTGAKPTAGTVDGHRAGAAHHGRVPGLSEEIDAAIRRVLDRGVAGP